VIIGLVFVMAACADSPEPLQRVVSPDGDIILFVTKTDLGSCCSNRLAISAQVFGKDVENLAEIKGGSQIGYKWSDPDTLEIVACNANEASFRSGFTNDDYARRFIVAVQNERPSEDGNRVICNSSLFQGFTSF